MIYINGLQWRLSLVPSDFYMLRRPDGTYSIGVCDNLTQHIYISNNLSRKRTIEVLYHEVTHAVLYSYGIDIPPYQEELISNITKEICKYAYILEERVI